MEAAEFEELALTRPHARRRDRPPKTPQTTEASANFPLMVPRRATRRTRRMDEMDTDRVLRIIAARCPELSQDDIAEAFTANLPAEIVPLIVDAIDALEAKLDGLEETVNGGGR
jgi:hypothetical protein